MPMTANGLAKLIEECGELIQVAGKYLAYYHTTEHPDGGKSLDERLEDEIADVMAACNLVKYLHRLDEKRINVRSTEKLTRFLGWHLEPGNNADGIDRVPRSAAIPPPPSFDAQAVELVGARPVELAEWAHEAKINLIRGALKRAFEGGRRTSALDVVKAVQPFISKQGTKLEELKRRLTKSAPMTCPECGPHIRIDEDGCCATCGADATHADDDPDVSEFVPQCHSCRKQISFGEYTADRKFRCEACMSKPAEGLQIDTSRDFMAEYLGQDPSSFGSLSFKCAKCGVCGKSIESVRSACECCKLASKILADYLRECAAFKRLHGSMRLECVNSEIDCTKDPVVIINALSACDDLAVHSHPDWIEAMADLLDPADV